MARLTDLSFSPLTAPRSALPAVILLALLTPGVSGAAWTAGGVPLGVASDNQSWPAITTDGAGGALIAWMDKRTGMEDIYIQRVSDSGAPLWTAGGVAVCAAAGNQRFPAIASDGVGGAIVVWKDERSGEFDVYAQRVDASGAPLWAADGVCVCSATGVQHDTEILADGAGGAFIVWRDGRGGLYKLYGQRVDAGGTALWTPNGVQLSSSSNQYQAALVSDGAGGFIMGFFDYRNANFDVFAQRVSASGAALWIANGVPVCTAAGNQYSPEIASDGAGGAILTWYDYRSGTSFDIYAQRITSTGAIATGWTGNGVPLCTASGDQCEPVPVSDGAGGAIITWYDNRSTVTVYAQHVTASGAPAGGWPTDGLRLCLSPATRPSIVSDGAGGALVSWHGTPGETNLDIVSQHVTGDAVIPDGWPADGMYICTAPNDQWRPVSLDLGGGDAILAWSDARTDAGDIYAQRVTAALANLTVLVPPEGFAAPAVPRNLSDAVPGRVTPTSSLDGNSATTCFNWGISQEGNALPAWSARLLVDGTTVSTLSKPAGNPAGSYYVLNVGPVALSGGRHTVAVEADGAGRVPESNEADNAWATQYVWSPLALERSAPLVRTLPPPAGEMAEPNSDGFAFSPTAGTAWVCGLANTNNRDNYDLHVYDDYAGSTEGFSHRIGASEAIGCDVDFVVGGGASSPGAVYPAAVRVWTGGGGQSYVIDATDAAGRLGSQGQERWTTQVLAKNCLADVFEGEFTSGRMYYLTLSKFLGDGDLSFSIFPCDPAGVYSPEDALASSTYLTADGQDVDVLTFVPPATGRYPIVIHRNRSVDAAEKLTYHFFWSDAVSGIGDDRHVLTEALFQGASPNPMARSARLTFLMPAPGPVTLSLYDVTGRLVRQLVDRVTDAGEQSVSWDGTGDDGAPVAAGVYWARFAGGGETITRAVTVVH